MKSIKMFGKSVPLLAIVMVSLLAIGASAVLVDYLSDTISATVVTVESPMLVGISLGGWEETTVLHPTFGIVDCYPDEHNLEYWTTTGTLTIPGIVGGDSITLYTLSENLADVEITAHEEIIISNPDGLTPDDFVTIESRFDSIYGDLGYGGWGDPEVPGGDCYNVDDYRIELWSHEDTSTWGAGEADVAEWVITFKLGASGTYTFSYRIVVPGTVPLP